MIASDSIRTGVPWYAEEAGYFGEAYLTEYERWITPEITDRQTAFATHFLKDALGRSVLDLGCG